MEESRLVNSIKNLQTAWLGQFINIFVKFVMRRFFVTYISDIYLGLDAVFTNIIGLMTLSELGIGTAAYYALYKPLAERDEERILGMMQLLSKVYKSIALFFTTVGLVLMPFITLIVPDIENIPYVHLLFGFYLLNTCVSYLFTYKGLLASADQKNYLTLRNHYIFAVGLNFVQILTIYFTRNFLFFAAFQSVCMLAEGVSLSLIMNREYPILKNRKKIELPRSVVKKLWSDVRKIIIGKIGNTVISSTDSLILSNVVGLGQTGIYSNYVLVKVSLQGIVCQFQSAIAASVGNIAASNEKQKELDFFWLLNFINVTLYAITSVCMFNLMDPFIEWWLGGNYIMDYRVLFLVTSIYYFGGIRGIFSTYSMAHGAFDLETKKAVLEAFVNLLASIVFAMRLGVVGVLLGTVISSIFVGLPLELINVCRAVPDVSKKRYVKEMVLYSIGMIFALIFSANICKLIYGFYGVQLIFRFVISVVVFSVMWCCLFGKTTNFKKTIELAKGIIYSRLK